MNDSWMNNLKKNWEDCNKNGKFLQKSMQYKRALSYFEDNLYWNRTYMNDVETEIISCENLASVLDDLGQFDKSISQYIKLLDHEYVKNDIDKKFRILLYIENVYHRKANKMKNGKLNENGSKALELIQGEINDLGLKFTDVFQNCNDRAAIYQDLKNFDDALVIHKLIKWKQDKNDIKAILENSVAIGFCFLNLKKYIDAIKSFDEARKLMINYMIDDDDLKIWIHFNLYQCYRKLNRVQLAICFLIKSLQYAQNCQNIIVECLVYEEYSTLFLNIGIKCEAYKYAQLHYIIGERMKNEFEMSRAQQMIDRIEEIIENDKSKNDSYEDISVPQAIGIENTIDIAVEAYETGNNDEAIAQLKIANTILQVHNDLKLLSIVYDGLGTVYYTKADQMRINCCDETDCELLLSFYQLAAAYFNKCLKLPEHLQRRKYIFQNLADIHFFLKNYKTAVACYQQLYMIALETDDDFIICESLKNIGLSHMKMKNFDQAIEILNATLQIAVELSFDDHDFQAEIITLLGMIKPFTGA